MESDAERFNLQQTGVVGLTAELNVAFSLTGGTLETVLPAITLPALLEFAGPTPDGRLVEAVAPAWFRILELLKADPSAAYEIEPRQWEEIIAGAYERAGFDEVVLTPRSGDHGRDVIATRKGVGSVRIFDQVKAYKPGHLVTADEVRSLAGVLHGAGNVSKGVVTTTSDFAPRLMDDPFMANLIPYRLELKPRSVLLPWLEEVRNGRSG